MEFDKWITERESYLGIVGCGQEILMREAFEAGVKSEREACAARFAQDPMEQWRGVEVADEIRARTK